MKRNTKQEILQKSKELFNERGFNGVSLRDIADELGISKGNLTYHFKRKEDIIETLLTEASDPSPLPKAPATLKEMDAFFLDIQEIVQKNAFYFWNHAQLSQVSPKIQNMQKMVFRKNSENLLQGFLSLREKGLLREETFDGEYSHTIKLLLISSIYWIPFCQLLESNQSDFRRHAWTTLRSLLTEQGLTEMLKLLS